MAYILRTDGTREEIKEKGYLKLETLQAAVGGYIETVPCRDNGKGKVMILNEEGKLQGLPYNAKATAMARGIIADSDVIVGDVVIADETPEGELL